MIEMGVNLRAALREHLLKEMPGLTTFEADEISLRFLEKYLEMDWIVLVDRKGEWNTFVGGKNGR